MRKNAALESSNVAVLLEHIPVGQTRSIHSLQVTRVEPDHYSIGGGKVMDLVDAISQIGSYTGHGKVSNPRRRNPAAGAKPKQSAGSSSNAQTVLTKIALKLEMYYSTPSMLSSESAIEEDLVPMLDQVNDIARATARASRGSAAGRMHQQALGLEEDIAELIKRAEQAHAKRARYLAYEASEVFPFSSRAAIARAREAQGDVYEEEDREVYPSTRRNPRSLSRPRATAKVSNPQKSERGYFYEVLDSKGRAVMLTTNKAEAAEVASDPIAYKLKKGTYTFRHIGAVSALESPPFRRL